MRAWVGIGLLWFSMPACAAVTNVTSGGWYAGINDAVAAAQPGDRLLVATGVYAESVIINKNLDILGGYDETFTALVAPFYSNIERHESYAIYVTGAACYLSRLSTRFHPYCGLFCDNAEVTADHCVFSFHEGLNNSGGVVLQNASMGVLSNCSIGACHGDHVYGGGATVREGCTLEVTGNAANIGGNWAVRGGGIWVYSNGTLRITDNAKVLQNAAQMNGGGIYGAAGSTIIIDHSFIGEPNGGNTASNAGGGLYVEGAIVLLTNDAIVAQNTALTNGGGVYALNSALTLGPGVLIGDYAFTGFGNTAGQDGGGMFVNGGTLAMQSALVRGNYAAQKAGGIGFDGAVHAAINDSTINDNSAATFGGGVYYSSWSSAPNSLLMADSMISNNLLNSTSSGGGGLYLSTWHGTIMVTNCSVVDNYALLAGGGIQTGPGTTELQRVLLMGNRAELGAGGGLVMAGSVVMATDCQFLWNHARLGGGLHAAFGTLWLFALGNSSQVSGNTADETGGGISADRNATVHLEPYAPWAVVVSFNHAAQGGGLAAVDGAVVSGSGAIAFSANTAGLDGGGIYASNATLALAAYGGSCPRLWQNTAGRHGGGAWLSGSTLPACIIEGNTAGDRGGGARLLDNASLLNGAVAGNVASNYGGGVSLYHAASLINVAVTGNTAVTADAGGIECDDDPGTPCLIRNCLVADNHSAWGAAGCVVYGAALLESSTIAHNHGIGIGMDAATARNLIVWGNTGGNIDTLSGAPIITYTCSAPGIDATGCISNDPAFADSAAGNFRLQESSPCIDTGENDVAWMATALDLDGNPRIYAWHEYRTDMGCYEFVPEPGGLLLLAVFTIYKLQCTSWRRRREQ